MQRRGESEDRRRAWTRMAERAYDDGGRNQHSLLRTTSLSRICVTFTARAFIYKILYIKEDTRECIYVCSSSIVREQLAGCDCLIGRLSLLRARVPVLRVNFPEQQQQLCRRENIGEEEGDEDRAIMDIMDGESSYEMMMMMMMMMRMIGMAVGRDY